MANSIYLFFLYLIPVIIGMATLSASAYGVGKYESNKESDEYKVSIVFMIISLLISAVSIMMWHQGNYTSSQCRILFSQRYGAVMPI
jgi:cell division protein FtsW (lipid II flippase)